MVMSGPSIQSPSRPATQVPLAVALALAMVFPLVGLAQASGTPPTPTPSTSVVFVNITASAALNWVPDQVTVAPGQQVHLIVTQAATFEHTFTLSSVVNATIDPSSTPAQLYLYFQQHPPLYNISLGMTPGATFTEVFNAPPLGSYEYVCTVPTHFQAGMHGEFIVAIPASNSGTTFYGLSIYIWIGIGVAAAALIAVGVLLASRSREARKKAETPPQPTPPK